MIQLDLNMKMPDKCSECNFFRVHNKLYCTAVVGNTTVSKPRERRPAWCPLHEVTDTDTISRQAAIDAIEKNAYRHTYLEQIIDIIKSLPSAQPEDCDTCKHGYFGDSHCDNCRVRYPSHYERRTE